MDTRHTSKVHTILKLRALARPDHWRLAAVALCAGAVVSVAAAQPADVAQGAKIAAGGTPQGATACIGCHGSQGEGSAAFPRLAGAGQAYLQAQLEAFASGARKSPVMQPVAQKLAPAEQAAVAAYYSQLAAPATAAVGEPTPADVGGWLAARGRWAKQLPACAQCHGADGGGVGGHFPPLAGLPEAYMLEQLAAWKSGARPPGPLGLMPAIAARLSDAEATAVAQYYASLRSSSAPAAGATAKPAVRATTSKGGTQ